MICRYVENFKEVSARDRMLNVNLRIRLLMLMYKMAVLLLVMIPLRYFLFILLTGQAVHDMMAFTFSWVRDV